jgi:hypothetical protein
MSRGLKRNLPWFWNFYDLLFDERFVSAVLRTLFVVVVCVSVELCLAVLLAPRGSCDAELCGLFQDDSPAES